MTKKFSLSNIQDYIVVGLPEVVVILMALFIADQFTNKFIGLRELRRLVLPVNSVSDTVLP